VALPTLRLLIKQTTRSLAGRSCPHSVDDNSSSLPLNTSDEFSGFLTLDE
jgi:hypothetical protein